MNKNILFLIVMCNFPHVINSFAQRTETLTVIVTNFQNAKGHAVVHLFREQDDIPDKPFITIKASIKAGVGKTIFENLPIGSYAAIAYHDENDNGTLDHKLAFPSEPMGFSNGWKLRLFSGMPSFKKLRFEHGRSQTELAIKVD
jgi:uncharacterized protein (DUF2141 family)